MIFTYQGEHHTDEDHNAGGNVLDEEDGGDEHTEQRDEHVAPEFGLDHLWIEQTRFCALYTCTITSSVSQLAYSVPTGKARLEKLASATICLTLFMAGIHSEGELNNLWVSWIVES